MNDSNLARFARRFARRLPSLQSFYKIFNAPVTSPDTLYVLIPPDFEKRDLLTFLESIFED